MKWILIIGALLFFAIKAMEAGLYASHPELLAKKNYMDQCVPAAENLTKNAEDFCSRQLTSIKKDIDAEEAATLLEADSLNDIDRKTRRKVERIVAACLRQTA